MTLKKLLLIWLFALLNFVASGNGVFKHISVKDGLSSNRTYRAVQDNEGFVWVTTGMGVDRFDGKNIVHYDLEMHDELSSYGYQFNTILKDENDNIFVVNNRSYIYRLNRNKDEFELIPAFNNYHGKYIYNAIISHNKMLCVTPSRMIIYDYKKDSLYKPPQQFNNIYNITDAGDGYLLIRANKIFKADHDLSTLDELCELKSNASKIPILRNIINGSKKGEFWIGTDNSGIFHFDLNTGKYKEVKANRHLKNFPVRDIKLINDTTLLIGSDGAGLIIMDTKTGEITAQYQNDQDDDNSISSNVIHGIQVTANSLYFITTDIGGISIMNPNKPEFQLIKRIRGNPNSLLNDVIYSIVEPGPGELIFGTDRGLSLWNRNKNKWKNIDYSSSGSRNNVVTQIATAGDGTFWVSYFIGETRVFNASPKFKFVPDELKAIKNSKAMLFDDRTNTLWMSRNGRNIRLVSYNFDHHSLNHYTIPNVLCLKKYKKKNIIVGTSEGLYIINIYTNDFSRFSNLPSQFYRITSIAISKNNKIWIGSDRSGIARIDMNSNEIETFTTDNGLLSNHIFAISTDNNGNLWASSDKGLSKIEAGNGHIINFFKSDGVVTTNFMNRAICKLHTGEIIIGSAIGATLFDPDKIKRNSYHENLVFTNLYVNQKKITPAGSEILSATLNNTDHIHLKYDENSFAIEFTNIDLIHPAQHKFSWILEGLEKEWTKPSVTSTASYSNLKPGEYTFRVRLISGLSSAGLPHQRTIKITITSPAWRTPVAFIIYFFVILLIIYLALYYNKLMHDVRSSREKLQYLANMAHEIKTPLTLIKAPIGDLLKKAEDKTEKEKLELAINNIEKLQKKIGQFLDLKKIDNLEYVHHEKIDIIAFVKKKIYAFNLVAERKNIKLTFESAYESRIIYCEPDMLDRIISNLLSNAIKYNRPGGFINVRIHIDDDHWTLIVTDSGIGIPRKELNKIFKPFFRAENAMKANKPGSGIGLALVADILKVLNGTITVKSKENKGTTFTLKFPTGEPDMNEGTESDDNFSESEETEETTGSDDAIKILVVEDDKELREYISKELANHYNVIEASDGNEAMTKVIKELPDLVLSDVAMPRMNGRQLCINIKSKPSTSHVPVILLSGLDSKEHILKGLEAGADDYITKPFDSSILIAKIENLINSRKKVKDMLLDPAKGSLDAEIKNDYDKEFVAKITALVEENISDPDVSVRMLYTSVGMSRTAFYHKLKSLIDMSPAEFIRLIRLNKSKELLLTKQYNINEVAYMCGFSDPKYFSTSFKKHFGKSPSAFVSGK
jgi:signal transduction histidine kinase/DNA-binding response OmpR family regulator/ligand-binding sensor domain-containing protein